MSLAKTGADEPDTIARVLVATTSMLTELALFPKEHALAVPAVSIMSIAIPATSKAATSTWDTAREGRDCSLFGRQNMVRRLMYSLVF
jgi:hypothetical protein